MQTGEANHARSTDQMAATTLEGCCMMYGAVPGCGDALFIFHPWYSSSVHHACSWLESIRMYMMYCIVAQVVCTYKEVPERAWSPGREEVANFHACDSPCLVFSCATAERDQTAVHFLDLATNKLVIQGLHSYGMPTLHMYVHTWPIGRVVGVPPLRIQRASSRSLAASSSDERERETERQRQRIRA